VSSAPNNGFRGSRQRLGQPFLRSEDGQIDPGTVSSADLEQGRSGTVWDVQILTSNSIEHEVRRCLERQAQSTVTDKDDDADDGAEVRAMKAFSDDTQEN